MFVKIIDNTIWCGYEMVAITGFGVRLENGKYPTLSALFILGSIY